MAQIDLVKRSELTGALSFSQVDGNWTAIEGAVNDGSGLYFCQGFAISDETTALTTGTKLTVYLPVSLTDISVSACLTTAATGAGFIADIHMNGTTIMTTNKLLIDATEFTTNTASTAPTVTTTTYTAFQKIEFIIDQVGSTVAGAGAKVFIIGNIV